MLQWLSRLQEKYYTPKYLGSVKQDQDTSYLKFSPILRLSGHGGFAHASFFYWDDPSTSEAITQSEWLPAHTRD